ncbi:MAG: glutamine synthetase [Planctomycetes bacterium]|nr:glutamine synthetase [Planctomycetota bacterium]
MSSEHTKDSVLKAVRDHGVESIWHWFVDLDGRLKGFAITPAEMERSLDDGMHFDGSSISGFNAIEESDLLARPDLDTFALLPHAVDAPRSARFFCDLYHANNNPYHRDTRHVLKRLVASLREQGQESYMGPELEFFTFASRDNPTPVDQGSYFTGPPVDRGNLLRSRVISALAELGIACEYHHHEVAPSQHEIDLRFDEVLRIADAAVTYKAITKQVAHDLGVYATFMPKPIFGQNGSGMHVHQSLFCGSTNLFFLESDPHHLSPLAKSYIAGLLKYAPECVSFWAPTVNSYKRLVPGYEAPTYIAWSLQNRSAMIRVPAISPGRARSMRCELRCPDPSANPYLAFALMLAAGMKGVEEKLPLEPPQVDNLYHLTEMERIRRGIRSLPSSLKEALDHTKESAFVRAALGESLVDNYLDLKYREFDEYRLQVTPWEIQRYYATL